MAERLVEMKLNDILPNDFPNEKSWARVTRMFLVADPNLLNLDSIKNVEDRPGVIITSGLNNGLSARDGNHTLARILQLFGPEVRVSFTPNVELRTWHSPGEFQKDVDWRIKIVSEWGVKSFEDFLKCCLLGRFYK